MKKILTLFLLSGITALVFTLFLVVPEVKATNGDDDCEAVCPPGAFCIKNPLDACSFEELVIGIANFIFWIATAVVPLMIVIGGFYFMTSAGNPQQLATAKKIILYSLIGYAIIFVSRGLIYVIKDILGASS